MAKKKTAGGLGVILVVVIIVGMKLLGGPDLTSLITGGDVADRTARQQPSAIDVPTPQASRTGRSASETRSSTETGTASGAASEDRRLEQLFHDETSDEILTLSGVVSKTLPDDNEGSRHQRFILRLASGRTVLVAHNIDLAERVPLREGDRLTLRGEYEWTRQGGTVHWTHHDPKKWREGGWIEHDGVRYE